MKLYKFLIAKLNTEVTYKVFYLVLGILALLWFAIQCCTIVSLIEHDVGFGIFLILMNIFLTSGVGTMLYALTGRDVE